MFFKRTQHDLLRLRTRIRPQFSEIGSDLYSDMQNLSAQVKYSLINAFFKVPICTFHQCFQLAITFPYDETDHFD